MTTGSPLESRAAAPWPYRAEPPQRYTVNHRQYEARGGKINLAEDVKGFVKESKNAGDMARFYFFCLMFDQLVKEGITGDLVELGVYKGSTASLLATFARRLGSVVYLLDTYEGFDRRDLVGIDQTAKLDSFRDTSLKAVRSHVGEENVRYVQGYFPATAPQLPDNGSYCLVHLDCDLYAPMASALAYFYPRLVPGGFLIAHDYSSLHWSGAEKAVDEFFTDKAEGVVPMPDNSGSVVVRKARSPAPSDNWLLQRRRALASTDWMEAGNGKLADLLGTGWSGPEPWGVWGVGECHTLFIAIPKGSPENIALDLDVSAGLVGARNLQAVDVAIGGETVAHWQFTPDQNRGIRRLVVPQALVETSRAGRAAMAIEFHPESVQRVCDIKPGSTDTRSIGLGLHRLRFTK